MVDASPEKGLTLATGHFSQPKGERYTQSEPLSFYAVKHLFDDVCHEA